MHLLIKNNDIDLSNIKFIYNSKFNFYKLYYDLGYIKLLGIPLTIKYDNIIQYNNMNYVYFSDMNIINILRSINKLLIDIPCLNIVRFNKTHFLICKNYDKKKITNPLTINIQKLKYKDGNYIPIIYII